jgi:hypothetical protein
MNRAALTLGFYASLTSLAATFGYGVVQVAQIFGIIVYPLDDILIFAFSLCIAAPFLLALLALQETTTPGKRLRMQGALLFGVLYVTYASLMYTVQLSAVLPASLNIRPQGVLAVWPQSLFWDIDGLAYVAMGISTTFAGLALSSADAGRWPRRFLLANGAITPIIAFIYFYPRFSIAVLLIGSPWLITAPGALLTLAIYFRTLGRCAQPAGGPLTGA